MDKIVHFLSASPEAEITGWTQYSGNIYRSNVGTGWEFHTLFENGKMARKAGEFYLDTSAGYLYYWARDGAIADQTIIAPKVKRIVSVIGASESTRAKYIKFEGLTKAKEQQS